MSVHFLDKSALLADPPKPQAIVTALGHVSANDMAAALEDDGLLTGWRLDHVKHLEERQDSHFNFSHFVPVDRHTPEDRVRTVGVLRRVE